MALQLISQKEGTSYNQATKTEYVYENSKYFDDEQNKYVYKRRVIGKIDPETGKRIATGPVGRPRMERPPIGTAENTSASAVPTASRIQKKQIREVLASIQTMVRELEKMQRILESQLG